MTDRCNTNSLLTDISLRFCSDCMKKFCPPPSQFDDDAIRVFIPTTDALGRDHFAYVELPRDLIEKAYGADVKLSFNLAEWGKILHIEQVEHGGRLSSHREKEIAEFYSYSSQYANPVTNHMAA